MLIILRLLQGNHWDMLRNMYGFLIVIALMLPADAIAGAYKWVDESGNIHYSDRPIERAEPVRLPGVLPAFSGVEEASAEPEADESVEEFVGGYRQFEILEPEDNQTIRSNEGRVGISLLVDPVLDQAHELRLELDGQPVQGRFVSTQMALRQVTRGTHSLRATIVDEEGAVLATSNTVNFHIRRESDRQKFADQ